MKERGKRCGVDGAPGEIRTPGLFLRREALYPAELRARTVSVHRERWGLQSRVGTLEISDTFEKREGGRDGQMSKTFRR
jgi:hypothetical protein